MKRQLELDGLVAAPFTPLNKDGSIDTGRVQGLVDHYTDEGLIGVFVCGSTGEGPSLTSAERMRMTEAFIQAAGDRLYVMVHVGHSSIAEARLLASHSAESGAHAVSATMPTYFKVSSEQILIECLQEIAAEAQDLPFYYYNIPSLTGLHIDVLSFLEHAEQKIPNLAGIKFSSQALDEYQACLTSNHGVFNMLFGVDEMLLPALAAGAKGFIGSTYNFAAPIYHRIRSAFEAGDLDTARLYQEKIIMMVRILVKYGLMASQKAIMKKIGYDCGPVRLPLQNLSTEGEEALFADLERIGFFDEIRK